MTWKIEFEKNARKEFLKLDRKAQKRILDFLSTKVAHNPRQYGKALSGRLSGLWRYRVGDYRIVCQIRDNEVIVVIARIAHRNRVYKPH